MPDYAHLNDKLSDIREACKRVVVANCSIQDPDDAWDANEELANQITKDLVKNGFTHSRFDETKLPSGELQLIIKARRYKIDPFTHAIDETNHLALKALYQSKRLSDSSE